MPLPRLPRHLRPCRLPWRAHQVRWTSDASDASSPKSRSPSTAGGDPAQRTTRPGRSSDSQRGKPRLRIRRQLSSKEESRVRGAIDAYLAHKGRLQETQQSGTSRQTEDELRDKVKSLEGQLALLLDKLDASRATEMSTTTTTTTTTPHTTTSTSTPTLAQRIQAQLKSMQSTRHPQSSRPAPAPTPASAAAPTHAPPRPPPPPRTSAEETSDQSLLDELFPEASSQVQRDPPQPRHSPPKLRLPGPRPNWRILKEPVRTDREKVVNAFRSRDENITVLQLSNCSTALTESDFRRLIPHGLHIDTWSRDGEFYKIIPGRNPISLERLPIYYLLFRSSKAAVAYQKNASRLSKLRALYAPSGIHSAVMPPAGFLEAGEDIHTVTSSFVLHPQGHQLDLRVVMQPYGRALRALFEAGGYAPIVPNIDEKGNKIHRVLFHIDGYEPSHWDLWQIISRHAHARGILWPFRNEHAGALRRLRDCINLRTISKTKFQAVSMSNPRSADAQIRNDNSETATSDYDDPQISSFLGTSSDGSHAGVAEEGDSQGVNQLVMNSVYNRWIVDFDDEDAARRFAGLWHRIVLPDAKNSTGAWKEAEEERWVEAEYLW